MAAPEVDPAADNEPAEPVAGPVPADATIPAQHALVLAPGASLPVVAPELLERAAGFFAAALSPATQRAYATEWATFERWCAAHGCQALPAAEDAVVLFLADCSSQRTVGGLERALSAIATRHRIAGEKSPRGEKTSRLLQGVRRQERRPTKQAPAIMLDDLRRMVAKLQGAPLRKARDRAVLTLGFHGGLRRSEIVGLDVGDVALFEPDGLVIDLGRAGSKTNQLHAREEVEIGALPEAPDVCPVAAVSAWLKLAGQTSGPLFFDVTIGLGYPNPSQRMSDRGVDRLVKRIAKRAGLDGDFSGHSLRAGFVTSMDAASAPDEAIRKVTRHTSARMIDRYRRKERLFGAGAQRHLARLLVTAPPGR